MNVKNDYVIIYAESFSVNLTIRVIYTEEYDFKNH